MWLCNAGEDNACYNLYQGATSLANSATLCEADRDNIWNAFKVMYLQVKRDLIQAWARSQCPERHQSAELAVNYVPHFATAAELLGKGGFTTPATPAEGNTQKAAAEAEIKKSYESIANRTLNIGSKHLELPVQNMIRQTSGLQLYQSC